MECLEIDVKWSPASHERPSNTSGSLSFSQSPLVHQNFCSETKYIKNESLAWVLSGRLHFVTIVAVLFALGTEQASGRVLSWSDHLGAGGGAKWRQSPKVECEWISAADSPSSQKSLIRVALGESLAALLLLSHKCIWCSASVVQLIRISDPNGRKSIYEQTKPLRERTFARRRK